MILTRWRLNFEVPWLVQQSVSCQMWRCGPLKSGEWWLRSMHQRWNQWSWKYQTIPCGRIKTKPYQKNLLTSCGDLEGIKDSGSQRCKISLLHSFSATSKQLWRLCLPCSCGMMCGVLDIEIRSLRNLSCFNYFSHSCSHSTSMNPCYYMAIDLHKICPPKQPALQLHLWRICLF